MLEPAHAVQLACAAAIGPFQSSERLQAVGGCHTLTTPVAAIRPGHCLRNCVQLGLRPERGALLKPSWGAQTPNEYIRWRYAMGEDRESVEKMSRQQQEEDEKALQQQIKTDDGIKRILDKLLGRRKAKRSYEYEVWPSPALPASRTGLVCFASPCWLERVAAKHKEACAALLVQRQSCPVSGQLAAAQHLHVLPQSSRA